MLLLFNYSVVSDSWQPHWLYPANGSSVHVIFQARIRECIAISSSRGSFQPRDQTQVSYRSPALASRFFTFEPLGKPIYIYHFALHQKLTPHCKSAIVQLKRKKKKRKKKYRLITRGTQNPGLFCFWLNQLVALPSCFPFILSSLLRVIIFNLMNRDPKFHPYPLSHLNFVAFY